jgi:hypothetical protein
MKFAFNSETFEQYQVEKISKSKRFFEFGEKLEVSMYFSTL